MDSATSSTPLPEDASRKNGETDNHPGDQVPVDYSSSAGNWLLNDADLLPDRGETQEHKLKAGTVETAEIRVVVYQGIEELGRDVQGNKDAGRVGEVDRLQTFIEYLSEYLRLLENTIQAHQETIRVLSECIEDLRT